MCNLLEFYFYHLDITIRRNVYKDSSLFDAEENGWASIGSPLLRVLKMMLYMEFLLIFPSHSPTEVLQSRRVFTNGKLIILIHFESYANISLHIFRDIASIKTHFEL